MGKTMYHNVHAIEDILLTRKTISPMNWFGNIITFVLANKNLVMSCKSPKTIRTYRICTDSALYMALRKLSPKGYFQFDYELVELVDDMVCRRTAMKGEKK